MGLNLPWVYNTDVRCVPPFRKKFVSPHVGYQCPRCHEIVSRADALVAGTFDPPPSPSPVVLVSENVSDALRTQCTPSAAPSLVGRRELANAKHRNGEVFGQNRWQKSLGTGAMERLHSVSPQTDDGVWPDGITMNRGFQIPPADCTARLVEEA